MTVLSDPLKRYEYDMRDKRYEYDMQDMRGMRGTYIHKEYNITVSDLYQLSCVLCDFHKVDVPWKDTFYLHPLLVGFVTHNYCEMISKSKLCP